MTKITLMPKDIDKIVDVIAANNIVSQIELVQEGYGISAVVEMSWYTQVNGYHTKMTVEVSDVEDW